MADGARLAHRWIKQVAPWADASVDGNGLAVQADLVAKGWHDLWKVGRACQIDFGGANNAPVVNSPSPDDLRDVCASGSDNLHPALHLKHVCDDALRARRQHWLLPRSVCNDHHGVVTQSDGRMETH